ncbi:MAG: hypothetical protein Q4G36_10070 [Paracoccus sp. (in: a-proteobacteria)]|nr:hypothetical protein [Paracoccus sp. (in: a-proteobacteria)]
MIALIRLLFFLFAAELVLYFMIQAYLRSRKREQLEGEWDRRHPEKAGPSRERAAFVRRSMQGFERTLKSRLVALVFILPTVAVIAIAIWANTN